MWRVRGGGEVHREFWCEKPKGRRLLGRTRYRWEDAYVRNRVGTLTG